MRAQTIGDRLVVSAIDDRMWGPFDWSVTKDL